jgi:iron complex transport system ATP-binding protein
VQIARALMTDPELLLLDEPAAGLDLGGREDLVSTLSMLALDEDAPATVLVSHHVEEIPPGFTHALLLREGRVVAAGPLEQVLTEQIISATFGMPLRLSRADDRWAARRRTRRRAG